MLAIFIECCRADTPQSAARQRGLQQVPRAHRTLRRARADDRVQLIDKQNDPPIARFDLAQDRLEPILKLAAVFRARKQLTNIKRHDPLVFHALRTITIDNPKREPLRDRRLPNARLTNQHRIVLRPARQHLHAPTDLLVTPDHRIKLPRSRLFSQINRIFPQRLKRRFSTSIRDVLNTRRLADCADRRLDHLRIRAVDREQLLRRSLHLRERHEQMLARHKRIAHRFRARVRFPQNLHHLAPALTRARACRRQSLEFIVELAAKLADIHPDPLENRNPRPRLILDQRPQNMQRSNLRVRSPECRLLRARQSLLRQSCYTVHHVNILHSAHLSACTNTSCKPRANPTASQTPRKMPPNPHQRLPTPQTLPPRQPISQPPNTPLTAVLAHAQRMKKRHEQSAAVSETLISRWVPQPESRSSTHWRHDLRSVTPRLPIRGS